MAFLAFARSAEVVLTTLLLEEIEFLERLESVDGQDEVGVARHTKASHVILQLDIVEDHCGDVVSVLFGKGLVW